MKQFFKIMFASMLGFLISLIIVFFILFGIIAAVASYTEKETVTVLPNSVLQIKLDEPIEDRAPNNPFENLNLKSLNLKFPIGLNKILENIRKAKTDENIKGIYMELTIPVAGLSTLEEIRNALIDFKKSGKFVISYTEIFSHGNYYLASVSDKIYLNPEGYFDFRGLSATAFFFKGTLDKLDIKPEIIRAKNNKFKSAVEPFLLDKMSQANHEQTKIFITSVWNHILNGISEYRKISVNELNDIADNLKIETPENALKYKLVDSLFYKDQVLADLAKRTGVKKDKDIKFISIKKYSNAPEKNIKRSLRKTKIAVIYATGEIQGGEGDNSKIGSEALSKTIREAREDSSIKAIVLRVNSPGGSVTASEVIYREVMLAKKTKPVIVSMGNLAASGGYWISCGANKILADPNTITGSIGVFGIMVNLQDFFKNKLGITFESVNTNPHSDALTMVRPLTEFERNVFQDATDKIYRQFLEHVSKGRNIPVERVDSIGQGRIWSGDDALRLHLIDEIGGLNKAIEAAAEAAKLKEYKIVELPKQEDIFTQIFKNVSNDGEDILLKNKLGEHYNLYKYFEIISNMKGVQARLPYELIIE